jgi:hypothetical protein
MKILKKTILTSLIALCAFNTNASIQTDILENQPIETIIQKAILENITIENILPQIAAQNIDLIPSATSYATCNKLSSNESILSSAFAAAPQKALEIAQAARKCNVTEEEILNSALASNIDPTTINEATAAGGSTSISTPGTISTNGLAAPNFGSAAGNGGGGVASAN